MTLPNYQQLREHNNNPSARKLLDTMLRKQSNLCVSADVTRKADLLKLATQVAPHICMLKTHADIIVDFDDDLITQLQQLAQQHDFVIFEDRKFADIGNTVRLQYSAGQHRIADWAQIIDAHPLPGPGIVQGLRDVGLTRGHGLFLLAQMSSADNLLNADYTQQALAMAEQYTDFVIGFICRERLSQDAHFIHCTPGVQLGSQGDNLGQQYITPQQAISDNKTDVIIVGRGIYQADDPAQSAAHYQQAGWQAYLSR